MKRLIPSALLLALMFCTQTLLAVCGLNCELSGHGIVSVTAQSQNPMANMADCDGQMGAKRFADRLESRCNHELCTHVDAPAIVKAADSLRSQSDVLAQTDAHFLVGENAALTTDVLKSAPFARPPDLATPADLSNSILNLRI